MVGSVMLCYAMWWLSLAQISNRIWIFSSGLYNLLVLPWQCREVKKMSKVLSASSGLKSHLTFVCFHHMLLVEVNTEPKAKPVRQGCTATLCLWKHTAGPRGEGVKSWGQWSHLPHRKTPFSPSDFHFNSKCILTDYLVCDYILQ